MKIKFIAVYAIGGFIAATLPAPNAGARPHFSDCSVRMDVPAPLTIGTLRTPEFPVKRKGYHILLRTENPRHSMEEMSCLLGTASAFMIHKCAEEPMVQGNWTVWNGDRKIAEGTITGAGGQGETIDERELGYFTAEGNGKYSVEMSFTKDGGPLKTMNVHLLVRQDYDFWCRPI